MCDKKQNKTEKWHRGQKRNFTKQRRFTRLRVIGWCRRNKNGSVAGINILRWTCGVTELNSICKYNGQWMKNERERERERITREG